MATRPLRRRKADPDCALSIAEVYNVMARHGFGAGLTADHVVEYCQAEYPACTGVTAHRVAQLLGALHHRNRIRTWRTDTDQRWAMPTVTPPEVDTE